MSGITRGEIKKLLVLESLPMPIHYTGGMDPISYGGTFTLERIAGTVPVEADRSAYLELPALRISVPWLWMRTIYPSSACKAF